MVRTHRIATTVAGLAVLGAVVLAPAASAAAAPTSGAPVRALAPGVTADVGGQTYWRGFRDGYLEGWRRGFNSCAHGFAGDGFTPPVNAGINGGFADTSFDYVEGFSAGLQRGFGQGAGGCQGIG